jgi:hypothetical protein
VDAVAMKFTTKHKVYAIIGGLALSALGYDRITGGPSASETAAANDLLLSPTAVTAARPVQRPAGPVATAAPSAGASDAVLVERLDALAKSRRFDFAQTRDAFTPAASWIAPQASASNGGGKRPEEAALAFVAKHRLISTVVNGKNPNAMVDGRLLRIGEELDGFRLVSITKQSACFELAGTRAELKFRAEGGATGSDSH